MTFDYATFSDNSNTIVKQIETDAVRNSHGFALILSHKEPSKALILQTMDLSVVLSALAVFPFERFWLHSRYSTTTTKGLAGCHAFTPHNGEYVMHNGVLKSEGSRKLPVDSMMISELLRFMPPAEVAPYLIRNESYANVYIINPEKGTWIVSRSTGGTLFWDENDNSSSSAIPGLCDVPFPLEGHIPLSHEIALPPAPVYEWPKYSYEGRGTPYSFERYVGEKDEELVQADILNPPATMGEWKEVTLKEIFLMEAQSMLEIPDWYDIYFDKAWDSKGIPRTVLDRVKPATKKELFRLDKAHSTKVPTRYSPLESPVLTVGQSTTNVTKIVKETKPCTLPKRTKN